MQRFHDFFTQRRLSGYDGGEVDPSRTGAQVQLALLSTSGELARVKTAEHMLSSWPWQSFVNLFARDAGR